jgi:hypothetical protein
MKPQNLPKTSKKLNLHEFAKQLVSNSFTQALSVEGQDALSRVSGACQYIQSDTNIVLNAILEADRKINWESLVSGTIQCGHLKSRAEVTAFIQVLKAHRAKALKDWRELDNTIFATSQLKEISEKELEDIVKVVEIYNESLPNTDVNSAVLSVVQLWCKDWDTDKQRNFSRLLSKTFEMQQLITK